MNIDLLVENFNQLVCTDKMVNTSGHSPRTDTVVADVNKKKRENGKWIGLS